MLTQKTTLHSSLNQGSNTAILMWMIFTALTIGLLFCFNQARADENPYALNYQTQQPGLASQQTSPETLIFTGKKRDEDNISMLENGFDLMGVSAFKAPDISPTLAVTHGKRIKADQILVYVKQAASKTPASQIQFYKEAIKKGQVLTEKDVVVEKKEFDYIATYWAKLPPPALGVHMVKLVPQKDLDEEDRADAKQGAQGLKILAVIHESPAEKAGILRGDQLLSINQNKLNKPEDLFGQIGKLRGKTVPIELLRNGEKSTVSVSLR